MVYHREEINRGKNRTLRIMDIKGLDIREITSDEVERSTEGSQMKKKKRKEKKIQYQKEEGKKKKFKKLIIKLVKY